MKNSLCLSMWIPCRHHALSCWYITPWHTNRILRENPHSPKLIFKLIIITHKTPLCNVKLIVAQTFLFFFFKPPFFNPVYTYTSALIIISFLVEMGIMRVMFPPLPPPPPPHNKQLNKPKHRDTCWYQYLFFQCIMQKKKKRHPKSCCKANSELFYLRRYYLSNASLKSGIPQLQLWYKISRIWHPEACWQEENRQKSVFLTMVDRFFVVVNNGKST